MNMRKALKVIFVEIITLVIGIISGFLLPKVLSVNGYVIIKTFSLYIAYSGMTHLGFSDGMYIVLGGKKIEKLDEGKISIVNYYLDNIDKTSDVNDRNRFYKTIFESVI